MPAGRFWAAAALGVFLALLALVVVTGFVSALLEALLSLQPGAGFVGQKWLMAGLWLASVLTVGLIFWTWVRLFWEWSQGGYIAEPRPEEPFC